MNQSTLKVAIIGGGCAGLTAAKSLIDLGYDVTIFEASSQFGGRARMVMVENDMQMTMLDNGQHILLGAYAQTLKLLAEVGLKEEDTFHRLPLSLIMRSYLTGNDFTFDANNDAETPYHLLKAFKNAKGISWWDKLKAIWMMRGVNANDFKLVDDVSLASFLDRHHQSDRIIKVFWEPLCLAALNTPIELASAQIFLNVLRDSFTGDKQNSDLLLPKLDLSQVLANPVSQYVFKNGGKLQLSTRVRSLAVEINANGLDHFKLDTKHGEEYFSHVVLAVSPGRLHNLVKEVPKLAPLTEQLSKLAFQPIYTIYIQYPKDIVLPDMMTGMVDSTSQWVFDRGQICNQNGLVAVIISADGLHVKRRHDELALEVINELSQCFGKLPKPLWYKVIAERRATYSCVSQLKRPDNNTPQPRLFLAGDYTYQEYPATIESAVRSGIMAANLVEKSTQFM